MAQTFRSPVLADALLPQASIQRDLALVLGCSLMNALAAQVAIPLPFTPVPITGQTFAVLLTGALLGSRLGAASMLVYLAEGLAGMPVFTGFKSGPAALLGPTGGYLVGFVLAAYLVGRLAERGWDRRPWTTALAMLAGNLAIYACGVSWLAVALGLERAIVVGVLPFLAGDVLKILAATALLPAGWRAIRRRV